jgi:hypothetical protein
VDDQHEEVEHIPWGELLASTGDGRRRLIYLAAGALAAVVLGMVVARLFASSPEPAPVAVETPAAATTPQVPVVTVPVAMPEATAAATSSTTVPAPVLYREADLMAFPPEWEARAAAARAEWFVTDFFTADLEPNGVADVRGALPAGVELPDMPQDAAVGLSYVEWARAVWVEEADTGVFRVTVAYRMLGAPPDRGFQRLPVRAVEVRVAVSDSGGTVVVDLPSPVTLPPGPTPEPWPAAVESAPQSVVEGAMEAAGGWGSEHRLVAVGRVSEGWRVMLTAADELGNRWPLTVYVDDGGERM